MSFSLPRLTIPAEPRVQSTIAAPIPALTATGVLIAWDVANFDNADMHDIVTDNTLHFAPIDGFYMIDVVISYEAASLGGRQGLITHSRGNKVLQVINVRPTPSANGNTEIRILAGVEMLAGESVKVNTAQSSGGTVDILVADTIFTMTRVGA